MGIVWNWKVTRSKMTKEQSEDAQSGEWIMQEIKNQFDNKTRIKAVIRKPDSVTIVIDHEKAPE